MHILRTHNALPGHVDDHAVDEATASARLIVDGLESGGDDLKVVIRLDKTPHVFMIPKVHKEGMEQAVVIGNEVWLPIGLPLS